MLKHFKFIVKIIVTFKCILCYYSEFFLIFIYLTKINFNLLIFNCFRKFTVRHLFALFLRKR